MLTQPNLVLRASGQPLPQHLWWKAGQQGEGQLMLKLAIDLFGSNIAWQGNSDNYLTPWTGVPLTADTALFIETEGLPAVTSTDMGVTQFWSIRGIYTDPNTNKQYAMWENTGYLAERQNNYEPFTGDQTPGAKLAFRVAAEPIPGYPGNIELYWVKA